MSTICTIRTSIHCLFVCLCNISALLQRSPQDTPYTGMCSKGTTVWLRICPKIVKHCYAGVRYTTFYWKSPNSYRAFHAFQSHWNAIYTLRGSGHVLREPVCAYMFWFRRLWSLFMPRDWHPVGWRGITASGRQLLHHFLTLTTSTTCCITA